MLGNLLSKTIKLITVPVDMVESVLDVATGGDGSKASKKSSGLPLPSELRDAICQPLEDLDD